MSNETPMRDVYANAGYDPAELPHPRDVLAGDITDDSVVVAYCVVRNPDPEAPATMHQVAEFPIGPDDVFASDEIEAATDGAISYGETSVPHCVWWANKNSGVPSVISIGYGDAMYGPDSDFDDPHRWDRLNGHVHAHSDSFVRFDLGQR